MLFNRCFYPVIKQSAPAELCQDSTTDLNEINALWNERAAKELQIINSLKTGGTSPGFTCIVPALPFYESKIEFLGEIWAKIEDI
jgi:hypothetical protein